MGYLASSPSEIRLENGTLAAGGTGLKVAVDIGAAGAVYLDQVSTTGTGWGYGVYAAHGVRAARFIGEGRSTFRACVNPYVFDAPSRSRTSARSRPTAPPPW